MRYLGYVILLKKYFLIDFGVLLLLIALPLYSNPDEIFSTIRRGILYSGFITPAIGYFEIKKSHQLPFFDNLKISPLLVYGVLLLLKIILSLSISLYV